MNMGPMEVMVVLAIAILVVGPKRMVEITRTIGRIIAQMRNLSDEFLGTIQAELGDTEQEVRQASEAIGIPSELQAAGWEARQAVGEITKGIEGLVRDTQRAGPEARKGQDEADGE